MSSRRQWLGPLCAILGAFGSSAKAIFVKLAYREAQVDPVTLLALRMIFSLPFFFLIGYWSSRDQAKLVKRGWWILFWLALSGFYLASFFDFWGLQYISVGLERLILFTYPAIVVLISAFYFKKKITPREVAALGLALFGIAFAFGSDLRVATSPGDIWIGGAMVGACSVLYAIYLVGNGQVVGRIGSFRFTGIVMTLSSVMVLVHFLITHRVADLQLPMPVYGYCLGVAIVSTVLPVFLTSEAVRLVGASRVSIMGAIGPILTIWLGSVFLQEAVTSTQLVGTALVLGGVTLVTRAKLQSPAERSTPSPASPSGE